MYKNVRLRIQDSGSLQLTALCPS